MCPTQILEVSKCVLKDEVGMNASAQTLGSRDWPQTGLPTKKGQLIPLSVNKQKEVEVFLDDQLTKGYIRPLISPQTSPIFFVPKKDGKKHMVQDYRYVNKFTIKNNYPLPLISQLVDKLKGCKLFTKMDLHWGYNNVRVKEGDEWKAEFVMHKRAFEPLVMYFGLCNSPTTFQKMMNEIFHNMSDVCVVYIDDLMVFTKSDNQEEHDKIMLEVLWWLKANDLFVKPEKYHFWVKEVDFLGMIVSCNGIKMDPSKVLAILKWPDLTNVKQVRAFLGLGNFYQRFIKDYAIIACPLTDLTCKDTPFMFGDKERGVFNTLKAAFMKAPVLQYPDQDREFRLETDASEFAVGGVLSVKGNDGDFRPVTYMSHLMTPPECNYPIHDKEMLAIIKATECWRHYLEATPYAFEIHTDHNNLTYFMRSQNLSKWQAHWQLWMSHFNYSLVYRKGTAMHVANPLSRHSDHYVHSSENNKEQVPLQPETVNKIIDAFEKSHNDRQLIISEFHNLPAAGHKGNKATYNTLWKHYRWKGMKEQVQQYVKHCQCCQKGKATNKAPAGELLPLPTPQGPWQDITVDFTEMPEFLRYNNILVVIDWFSKEAVFIPCTKEENALMTAELFRDHVWCQYSLPSSVISDRESIFTFHFMGELYKILEIKQKMSTAFHPQTDGQTEWLNREINTYLRIYVSDHQQDWAKWIKIAQFFWNNTVSFVMTDSPFGMTRSYSPHLRTEPVDVSAPVAKDFVAIFNKVIAASEKAKITMKSQANKHHSVAPIYNIGDQVWLSMENLRMLNRASKKLTEKWIGPYEISSVMPNAVKLKLLKTLCIHPVVNISWVKPYLGPLPGQPISCPGPIHVTEDHNEEYEVDAIIDLHIYKGKLQYLVYWKGYDESERTWEPVSNLKNSPEVVEQFHQSHPSTPWHLQMTQVDFTSLFSMMPGNLCDPFPTFCRLESNT